MKSSACSKVLFTAVVAASITTANAQDGMIDPDFGIAPGTTTIPFEMEDMGDDQAVKVLVGSDKRIYLAGTSRSSGRNAFSIARLDTQGLPDPTYQGGAMASLPPGETRDFHATTAALQADGKLLVAGYVQVEPNDGDRDVMICRFTTAGNLDATFGSSTTLDYSGCEQYGFAVGGHRWDVPMDMLIQPDGRIALVGYATRPGDMYAGLFVRLDADGQLDTTFYGTDDVADGWSSYPAITSQEFGGIKFSAVARRSNGSFVIGFYSGGAAGDIDDAESTTMGFFSSAVDGVMTTSASGLDFGASDALLRTQVSDIAMSTDDTFFAVGSQETSPGNRVAGIAKFKLPFSTDATFSDDGVFSSSLCGLCEDTRLTSIALASDGMLVAAGVLKTDRYRSIVLRMNAAGELDPSFGSDGIAGIDLQSPAGDETLTAVALHGNRALVAGRGFLSNNDAAFTAARLTNDAIFRTGTEPLNP